MKKDEEIKVIDENLEQLEEELELNIENNQAEKAEEMIELIDIHDDDYEEEAEHEEFEGIEFINQDDKKTKKINYGYQIFRFVVTAIALFAFGYASYELMKVQLENDTSFATKDEIANMFLQDVEDDDNSGGTIVYTSDGETIVMENSSDGKAFVWDYEKMLEYNSESVGYIRQGNGEYIDYPILQHSDNDYYLYHLPDHKWSSMGSIFLDYRIQGGLNADYSIVYGHYIGKRANNIMFGSLNWYWNRAYYHKEHPDFDIYVENRHYKYYVFSIMKVPASGHRVYNPFFESDEERLEFLQDVKSQSKYEFTKAPELTLDSKVIMLSTCTTDKTIRFVMFLVRGEEIYDVPGVDYDNLPEETDPETQTPPETSSGETETSVDGESNSSSDEATSSSEQTTKPEDTTTPPETTKPVETTPPETTTKPAETTKPEETTPPETTAPPETPEETTPPESASQDETPSESDSSSDTEPAGSSENSSSENASSEDSTTPLE